MRLMQLFYLTICASVLAGGCAKEVSAVMLVPTDRVEIMRRDQDGALIKVGETREPLPVIRCDNLGKDDYVVIVRYRGSEAVVANGSYKLTRRSPMQGESGTNSCG
jgi:hypothetical protein